MRLILKKYGFIFIAVVLIIIGLTVVLLSDPYRFRPEPQMNEAKYSLEKKDTSKISPVKPMHNKKALPDNLRRIYDVTDKYISLDSAESFWLDNVSNSDFKIVLNAYLYDHPEVFWIDSSSLYSYYETDSGIEVELKFSMSGEKLNSAKKELDAAVKKAFTYVPDTADDLELEVFINDYIVNHCKYNSDAAMCHSAYGALVKGEAVCDGYSKAFQVLCCKAGIECAIAEGTSDFNEDSGTGHMWNFVKLGENWYNTDVTWNDIDSAKFFCERYLFLNLTDSDIKKNHKFSPLYTDADINGNTTFNVFMPECGSEELRYINICCAVISDIEDDSEPIASLIKNARNEEKSCAFVIDKKFSYNEICDKLISGGYINEWINGANHYLSGKKIGMDTKAYTYPNQGIVIVELNYE